MIRASLALVLFACATSLAGGCAKLTRRGKTDGVSDAGAAARDGETAIVLTDAGADADAGAEREHARIKEVTATFEAVSSLVARGILRDPKDPAEDAAVKCATLERLRGELATSREADVQGLIEDATRLCALDVPLLVADDALKQLGFKPSQASRLLGCKVASRELGTARATSPDDPRLRQLDARYRDACR